MLTLNVNKIPKKVENNLTNILAFEMNKRRNEMTKFDESSEEESDWSDD